jgi:hypothetical protein
MILTSLKDAAKIADSGARNISHLFSGVHNEVPPVVAV